MHDRKKVRRVEPTELEAQFTARKIEKFRALYAECFAMRDAGDRSRGFLQRSATLLEINPECYSIFAHRRITLEQLWGARQAAPDAGGPGGSTPPSAEAPSAAEATDEAAAAAAEAAATADEAAATAAVAAAAAAAAAAAVKMADLVAELELNTRIITKDFKCYAAWVHRHWVVRHLPGGPRRKMLQEESAKLDELLLLDQRNFHAWGYRRQLAAQLAEMGLRDDAEELAFSEAMLRLNFSNYSAWHNRVLVLRGLAAAVDAGGPAAAAALLAAAGHDMQLASTAFYCDPADQSAWQFAHWVLAAVIRHAPGPEAEALVAAAADAAANLCEDEPSGAAAKWPLLTLALVLQLRDAGAGPGPAVLAAPVSVAGHRGLTTRDEICAALADVDPLRRGRYAAGYV